MRIMAIDYGDARTGVAISDLTGSIVGTTLVVPSYNREKTLVQLKELVEQHSVTELNMGFPKNMGGT